MFLQWRSPRTLTASEWLELMGALSDLLRAGISLQEGLELCLILQPTQSNYHPLNRVIAALGSGQGAIESFSTAGELPRWLKIALVCAQADGNLAEHLHLQVCEAQQREQALASLRNRLAYPLMVFLVSLVSIYLMVSLPNDNTIQPHTRHDPHLLQITQFDSGEWLMLAGFITLITSLAIRFGRHPLTRIRNILPAPYRAAAQWYQFIAIQLRAGISLTDALLYSSEIDSDQSRTLGLKRLLSNRIAVQLHRKGFELRQLLKQGTRLSQACELAGLGAWEVNQIRRAEHTGELSECFQTLSRIWHMKHQRLLSKWLVAIPHVILTVCAVAIVLTYLNTLAPLYSSIGQ